MSDIYYYEQRNHLRGPGKLAWVPKLSHGSPPIESKTAPPIRGVKKLKAEDHEGWTLFDFQATYGGGALDP